MSRDITVEVELPYEVKEVWLALTDPEALADWLMPVEDFAATVGTKFRLRAKPMPGWDGVVFCEVTEVDEPHRLAYTWRGSRMGATTTVTWRVGGGPPPLPPAGRRGRGQSAPLDGNGTRLRLEHQGFTGLGGAVLALMHRNGWKNIVRTRLTGHLGRT